MSVVHYGVLELHVAGSLFLHLRLGDQRITLFGVSLLHQKPRCGEEEATHEEVHINDFKSTLIYTKNVDDE